MKVNPDTISICLEYLEKTKQVFDREECKSISKDLMSNLYQLEEVDFDKAIRGGYVELQSAIYEKYVEDYES